MNKKDKIELFPEKLLTEIRDKFYNVDYDPYCGKRIYFENAGGSLTLKEVIRMFGELETIPGPDSRPNPAAKHLNNVVTKGKEDFNLLLGAKSGKMVVDLSSSKALFRITGAIVENIPGDNVVTTDLEHPANYDAAKYYAQRTGKELRVAEVNPINGGVDKEAVLKKIDKNTCLLTITHASNISGAVLDIETIISEARKINPNLFVLVDAVQHAPHSPIDVERLKADALVIGLYKMFGRRGFGLGWVSDRVSKLPHERNLANSEDNWELGSKDPTIYASITAVVDYICWIGKQYTDSEDRRTLIVEGMTRIHSHETALLDRAINGTNKMCGLREIKGVKVHFIENDISNKHLVIALNIEGKSPAQVRDEYKDLGIIVFERVATSPFSKRTLEAFNLEGLVRVSPIHYNTPEEIDAFLKVTKKIAQSF